jgi:hypothetical protein
MRGEQDDNDIGHILVRPCSLPVSRTFTRCILQINTPSSLAAAVPVASPWHPTLSRSALPFPTLSAAGPQSHPPRWPGTAPQNETLPAVPSVPHRTRPRGARRYRQQGTRRPRFLATAEPVVRMSVSREGAADTRFWELTLAWKRTSKAENMASNGTEPSCNARGNQPAAYSS